MKTSTVQWARKIMVVCVMAASVALWFSTTVAYTGIKIAAAQDISRSPTPDDIRNLAEELEATAKVLRRNRTSFSFSGGLYVPFIVSKRVRSKVTKREKSKALAREMQRIRNYAPVEFDTAMAMAEAVMNAVRHQADTFDALARKLRQEAGRLEREQKKKN